jgi:glycosyltransferase involved in cell wall biosynthesis
MADTQTNEIGVMVAPTRHDGAPQVSVVIPAYNAVRHLPETLASVAAQTHPPLEIIVVDDGSPDGTAAMVRQQFPSVICLTKANEGVAQARNHGAAHARGTWIAFLDADDLWLPRKIAAQMAALGGRPDADLCFTDCTFFTDAPRRFLHRASKAITPRPEGGAAALFQENFITTSTVMVRKDVFEAAGRFSPGLRGSEDWDLWLRIAERSSILYVPDSLALYRRHGASATGTIRAQDFLDQHEIVCQRAVARNSSLYAPLVRRARARFAVSVAYEALNRSDGVQARGLLSMAIGQTPLWPWPYLLFAASFMPRRVIGWARQIRTRIRRAHV